MLQVPLRSLALPLFLCSTATAQTFGPPIEVPRTRPTGNILLVMMDDVGPDMIDAYGTGLDTPPTPTFSQLAADGVLFRRMYSNPAGSVTMATVETGRVGELTGIGYTIYADSTDVTLPLSEVTIPEMLDLGTGGRYKTALFGKWFLGKTPAVGGIDAPIVMGYDHYEGVMEQLWSTGHDFFNYEWIEDSVATPTSGYVTSQTVDEALDWIATTPEPWFCHVDFHAAHTPYHEPPASLYTVSLPPVIDPHGDLRPWYKAMVEAMDMEVGRMLATMDPGVRDRTTVIFCADNGTPQLVVAPPLLPEHGKSTVYEGGIHIPMVISGYAVNQPGREVDALAQTTDLFDTIAELAGVDIDQVLPGLLHQSVSMVPYLKDPAQPAMRDMVFAELFHPNGLGITTFNNERYAARDDRFKLIRQKISPWTPLVQEMYDLSVDPLELNDLMLSLPLSPEAQASYDTLLAHIMEMVAL